MADMNTLPVEGKYVMYKNKPLVREGNTICYGDRSTDACFLVLEMIGSKTVKGVEVPSDIFIQIVDSANPAKILKQGEKPTLTEAFSLGLIWFDRYSKKQ